MSRQTIIDGHVKKHKLSRHKSLDFESLGIPQDDTPRTLYISPDISAAVSFPFADTPEGGRLGEFRAWLDDFIEGAEISVGEDPQDKPPDTDLARVCPVEKEFWSIRVTRPEETPGIRSLGAFSDKDEFVALTWEMRERIGDFNEAVESAIQVWGDYFGFELPHRGASLNEYLTINYRAV
jgi:hypothetical protein